MKIFFFSFFILFIFLAFSFPSFVKASSFNNPYSKVNYTLPYSGLLPDNPLYKLKVIRDIIVGFFISDPIQKADYSLNLADKRTFAAQILFDVGKQSLALDTISKAQNYYEQSLEQIMLAKKQGEQVAGQLNKMSESEALREYMLSNMKEYARSSLNARFGVELQRAISLEAIVNKINK